MKTLATGKPTSSLLRFRALGALALIVAVALAVRFYALRERGFMYWDEGHYALEGLFLTDTWQRLLGTHLDPSQSPIGRPPVLVKPTHALLLSLSMLVAGPSPLATQAVSALLGTLTVLVVFLIGRSLYSTGAGLLAAAFLAVMPLHVSYSRQSYSEANATFIFALSVLLYCHARGGGRRAWLSITACGVLLGVAATVNYRLYIMALVFGLCELSRWAAERGQTRIVFLRRSILLAYSILLPVVLWSVFFRWLQAYWDATGLPIWEPIVPYESQLKGFLLMMRAMPRPMMGDLDPLYYPFVLWSFVGAASILALVPSAALFLPDRKAFPQNLLLASWLLVPLAFYTLLTDKAPRCLAVALPSVSLIAARGLLLAWERLLARRGAISALGRFAVGAAATAILVEGAVGSWDLVGLRGGYGPMMTYMAEHGIRDVVASQSPVVYFYTGGKIRVSSAPNSASELRELYEHGFRHILIDDQMYLADEQRRLAASIERRIRPVFTVPDTVKQDPFFVLEHSEWMRVSLERSLALHREIRETRGVSEVRVYDLRQLFEAEGGLESLTTP